MPLSTVTPASGSLSAHLPDGAVSNSNAEIVNVTSSTLAVTKALHNGRTITLNRAAGIAVTLPASLGDGSVYRFVIGTTITSNSTTIKVANTSDAYQGLQ